MSIMDLQRELYLKYNLLDCVVKDMTYHVVKVYSDTPQYYLLTIIRMITERFKEKPSRLYH